METTQNSLVRSMGERIPHQGTKGRRTSVIARRRLAADAPRLEELSSAAVRALPRVEMEPGEDDPLQEAAPVVSLHGVYAALGTDQAVSLS